MKKSLMLGALLCGSAAAQGSIFSPLTEVCPRALDVRNYSEAEKPHLIRGQGSQGWLYGDLEFKSFRPVVDYAPELHRMKMVLQDKGIALMVLYVPPRPVSASKYLDLNKPAFKGVDLQALRASYDDAIRAVNVQGIYSPHVLALQENNARGADFFYARDHHLNTVAMTFIAEDLAAAIRKANLLSEEDKAEFRLTPVNRLMMGSYNYVNNQLCRRFVLPSTVASVKSEKVNVDLLDEAAPKIVLAGDSNVFRDDGEESLAASLRHKLQADVLNVGIQGGGATASLQNYALSKEFQDAPPKLIIWEMDGAYDLRPFFKQIIPAIRGRCASPVQTASFSQTVPAVLKPTRPDSSLVFTLKNPAIRTLKLEFQYQDSGARDAVELSHSEREAAHPVFYFEPGRAITDLKLTSPVGAQGIEVAECAGPSAQ